jgi:hypothetical protein
MAGVDALRPVERELALGGVPLCRDRLEQEGVVIAGVGPPDHAADEPVRAVVEDRHAVRPLAPGGAGELVDVVAGLAAEQLGQLGRVCGDAVHAEHVRVAPAAERAVLVRQAHREARRVDAHLRGEAHEAPERLVPRARGDDEHRVLEVADERVEGRRDVAHTRLLPGHDDSKGPLLRRLRHVRGLALDGRARGLRRAVRR